MSNKDLLENIKKLREMTGVGFKDCKAALDDSKGDIEKSIEYLRKKGIAKASKKMSRTASEGLALVKENKGQVSIIEINSETDFVAKNKDFISFDAMFETIELYFSYVKTLELNDVFKNSNTFCEPQLGKRGLYPSSVNPEINRKNIHNRMHLLSFSDGKKDLIEIAELNNTSIFDFEQDVKDLLKADLLIKVSP